MNEIKFSVKKKIDNIDENFIYLVPKIKNQENSYFDLLNKETNNKLFEKEKRLKFDIKNGKKYFFENIFIFGIKEEVSINDFQIELANSLRAISFEKYSKIVLVIPKYLSDLFKNDFKFGEIISEAIYLTQYNFLKYKSEEIRKENILIEEVTVVIEKTNENDFLKGIEFGKSISSGIYLTRDLVNEPGSYIHTENIVKTVFDLQKEIDDFLDVEILDEDECKNLGMNAYLSVGEGSNKKSRFIVIKTKQNKSKKIALVGKTVTFDSGGISIKPSDKMELMKIDMAGGATVIGIFKSIIEMKKNGLEIEVDVVGILPVCENMPSGSATRPGDIVSAMNGKTIEIINTDAEGRMTLADALVYAEQKINPDYVIDIATLTGAMKVALGSKITGLLGNNKEFNQLVLKSAEEENEDIWELPLYKNYTKYIKSDVADLKNVGMRGASVITAALFLKEFISDKMKWVHLDIAETSYNEEASEGIYTKGATGWGVKTIISLLKKL